jgi:hypothetical protein
LLVELVILLNVDEAEDVRSETLRLAALAWEARTLDIEPVPGPGTARPRRSRGDSVRRSAWLTAVADSALVLEATEAARRRLEQRFLDGRGALFPDTAAAWRMRHGAPERLARPGVDGAAPDPRRRLGIRSGPGGRRSQPAAIDLLAGDLAAALLGRARLGARTLMGDSAAVRTGAAETLLGRRA